MSDTYNLRRFEKAQDSVYKEVLAELKLGHKNQHWMWYIFPQIKGLGRSGMAQQFAIKTLEEARAYLEHPVLGLRVRECTQLLLNLEGLTAEQIFGHTDSLKFRSSMTLFMYAAKDNQIFKDALFKYFEGKPDQLTLNILKNL